MQIKKEKIVRIYRCIKNVNYREDGLKRGNKKK